MISAVDLSPRKVWLGLTVPGKKMVSMISPVTGIQPGKGLIELYEGSPYLALWAAAVALRLTPEKGSQFGPAARSLGKPLHTVSLNGAVYTDIRDFLKMRFRASGMATAEPEALAFLNKKLESGEIERALEAGNWEDVIGVTVNYSITALDSLSRAEGSENSGSLKKTKDLEELLSAVARQTYPGDVETYDLSLGTIFKSDDKSG